MLSNSRLRLAASATVAASLVFGVASVATAAPATPSASPSSTTSASASPTHAVSASATPSATPAAPTSHRGPASDRGAAPAASVPTTDPACANPQTLTLFNINDFHGRIEAAAKLFTVVEQARAADPDHVMLLSAGDNIGASTFVSMSQDDLPTIQVLNAAGVQASAVGNHEFDGGWDKLRDEYIGGQNLGGRNPNGVKTAFPYLAANMTGVAPTVQPYTIITQNGVRVAVIGAEVSELPGLVSPAGIQGLTVSPEAAAVNAVADDIRAKGLADVVVAEVHNNIQAGFDKNVDVVFNGHTHEAYSHTTTDNGQPVLQAASYGTKLARVDLRIGTGNVVCGAPVGQLVDPAAAADASYPAIAQINSIVSDAKAKADEIGNQVIGKTCGPIQRAVTPSGNENRAGESTATDLVAQMFYDVLSNGNPNFIGMQNPGGTRADLPGGDITYAQANAVLPFANTLMTTQITGAQLKTVLEEQWQRDAKGAVPTRPYLQLGLSKNVTYTYDESLPEGSRITSITVNGAPYDPAATYTVGSGSFLISGGDNFWELGRGKNPTDTGKIDLSQWVQWLKDTTAKNGTVCQSNARQAVSVKLPATTPLACGSQTTITLGQPLTGGVAADTLNFSQGAPAESTVTVYVGDAPVGTYPVSGGVATIALELPATGPGGPVTLVTGNGTRVSLAAAGVSMAACPAATPTPTPSPAPTATPKPPATSTPAPVPTAGTPTAESSTATTVVLPGLPNTGSSVPLGLAFLAATAVVGGGLFLRRR